MKNNLVFFNVIIRLFSKILFNVIIFYIEARVIYMTEILKITRSYISPCYDASLSLTLLKWQHEKDINSRE